MGHSGCGKSTVVKLLLRFYDPTKGKVLSYYVERGSVQSDVVSLSSLSALFPENEIVHTVCQLLDETYETQESLVVSIRR